MSWPVAPPSLSAPHQRIRVELSRWSIPTQVLKMPIPSKSRPSLPPTRPASPRDSGSRKTLVWLTWLYFWLLIFEGALRKWILPEFADPLLIVRDPVAIVMLFFAWRNGLKFPRGVLLFLLGTGILFCVFGLVQMGTGLISPKVFLFGIRTYFLHLPVLFIIGSVLRAGDVSSFIRWTLLISLPMTVLMAYQFISPPGAWINKGIGDEGTQLMAARDHVRAAGTFSFVTGTVGFCTLMLACCLTGFFERRAAQWNLNHVVLAAAILVTSTSGSRALFLSQAIVLLAMVLAIVLRRGSFAGGTKAIFVGAISVAILTYTSLFQEGMATIQARTLNASVAEGGGAGLAARIFSGMIDSYWAGTAVPFYGAGIGLGTNVGSQFATGEIGFLLAEGEWGRVFGEVGVVGGILYIGFRAWLVVVLFLRGVRAARNGTVLALLLWAAAAPQIWNGQWGQPTALGFAVFVGGLAWAAGETGKVFPPAGITCPDVARLNGRRRQLTR